MLTRFQKHSDDRKYYVGIKKNEPELTGDLERYI